MAIMFMAILLYGYNAFTILKPTHYYLVARFDTGPTTFLTHLKPRRHP